MLGPRPMLPVLAFLLVLPLASCGGGDDSDPLPASLGSLRVLLTDAPLDELSQINVYISGFSVKPGASPVERIASEIGLVDLLVLRDVNRLLLTSGLEQGGYEWVQIELDQSRSYVVERDSGDSLPLRIPSEEIKVLGGFTIEPSLTTTITLDFDAERSMEKLGNGDWLLHPVIVQTNVDGPR